MSRPLQQIDLYVAEVRLNHDWLNLNVALKGVGILSLLLMVWTLGLVWSWHQHKNDAELATQQLASVKNELEHFGINLGERKKDESLPSRIEAMRKDLESRKKSFAYVTTQKNDQEKGFASILTSLATKTMNGVWLTRIAIADSGERMQLEGKSIDPGKVPAYLKSLTHETAMMGRNFDGMSFDRDKDDPRVISFILNSGKMIESANEDSKKPEEKEVSPMKALLSQSQPLEN